MKSVLILLLAINLWAGDDVLLHTNKIKADGKNVILFFGTKSCPYCEVMKKDFKEDEYLNKLLKDEFNVYYIPLDTSVTYQMGNRTPPKEYPTASLKMAFAVKATPQLVIFDENFNKLVQLPGYADRSQMKIFLDYVGKDIYKNTEFLPYLKKHGLMK